MSLAVGVAREGSRRDTPIYSSLISHRWIKSEARYFLHSRLKPDREGTLENKEHSSRSSSASFRDAGFMLDLIYESGLHSHGNGHETDHGEQLFCRVSTGTGIISSHVDYVTDQRTSTNTVY